MLLCILGDECHCKIVYAQWINESFAFVNNCTEWNRIHLIKGIVIVIIIIIVIIQTKHTL